MHPLSPDVTCLSDQELQQKCTELLTKMNQAYSMGNGILVSQIQMIYEDYNGEMMKRQQKAYEELMDRSSKFKKIIDIK
jgi:hypothetical protein